MERPVRPPGPKSRGIAGNFPMGSKDPLGVFTGWAREFGDIFYYRSLWRRVYFVNHPDLVRYVLQTNYQNFVKGEALRFNKRIFGNGLVTNEGESWLRQRRLIQPAFHRERIASYGTMMVAHTQEKMAGWRDGDARDIHQEMMELTLDIVAKLLFNVEIGGERDAIFRAMNRMLDSSSGVRMMLPPSLRKVPTPGNVRHERAIRRLDEIVYGMIRVRRSESDRTMRDEVSPGASAEDVLSTLIAAKDEDGNGMPDRQVRDEVMTLLLAGHETTAVTLSWTWYLLAQNPEAEQKLWDELRQALNGRSPGLESLPALGYADAVIKEAMRLYPPVWALARSAVRECEIGGYRVPAGATVVVSQWVMHRDPRFFDEPELFRPERWMGEAGKGAAKSAYFPFSGGPRACIGASFATMEAVLVLATIAQRFCIRMAAGCTVEPNPTITLRPRNPVRVTIGRRPCVEA